jgi:hypothetical protein
MCTAESDDTDGDRSQHVFVPINVRDKGVSS